MTNTSKLLLIATTVVIPTIAPATNSGLYHAEEQDQKSSMVRTLRGGNRRCFLSHHLGSCTVLKETVPQVEPLTEVNPLMTSCTSCGSMGKFRFFVVTTMFEWFDRPLYNAVLQTRMQRKIMGVIGNANTKQDAWQRQKKKNDKKGKGKSEYLAPKAGIVKQKFQGTCYNCDQPGHRAANCKMPKRVNPRQANMVDENVDMIAMGV
ncbi:retrotransposon protein, putative, ty1-copia subclass [Tanacetum coccineum]